jgi:hypothetical protein
MKQLKEMDTRFSWLPIISLIILLAPLAGKAADQSIDCSVKPYDSANFNAIYDLAKESAHKLCVGWLTNEALSGSAQSGRDALILFGESSRLEIAKKIPNAELDGEIEKVIDVFSSFGPANSSLPEMVVDSFGGKKVYFSSVTNEQRILLSTIDCANANADCPSSFNDLKTAFNAYRDPYDKFVATKNKTLVRQLGSEWDRFLEVSKSQTVLETILTTKLQGGHFKKDHLVGPPPMQIIALHPQVVYDSMLDDNQQRSELGLAVEWIGVNFWDWKVPLGISYTSVYVDRDQGKDTRHGVMIHVDNKYAIGWAKGDGDDSIFVSVDLLKLIGSKKSKLEKYIH